MLKNVVCSLAFIIPLVAVVALGVSDVDAKRGKARGKNKTEVTTPVEVVNEYCERYCQPTEWTPAGSGCVKAVCIPEDEYGFPNCEWFSGSSGFCD